MIIIIENLGIAARDIFSRIFSSNLPNEGSKVNAKKIIPPIQIAETRL